MNGTISTITPVVALTGLLAAMPVWALESAAYADGNHDEEASPYMFEDEIGHSIQGRNTTFMHGFGSRGSASADGDARIKISNESAGLVDETIVTRPLGRGALSVRMTVTPEGYRRTPAYPASATDDRREIAGVPNSAARYAIPIGDIGASYVMRFGRHSAVSGSLGLLGTPALGPSDSGMQRYLAVDERYAPFMSDWLYAGNIGQKVVTFGYSWRNFRFESSTFARRDPDRLQDGPGLLRMESQSRRLSFKPAPDWTLQFSRGQLGSLDQLDPSREIKRSTLSATYSHRFSDGTWQSIFAWGRNSGKNLESTRGYLMESTLRLATTHAFFGRMEQIGSDNMLRENDVLQRQATKMNKLTFGYAYDVPTTGSVKYDVGGLVTRNYGQAAMPASYGTDRISYLMFIRFKMK